VLAERWLFFAEAKEAVTLYYGSSAACDRIEMELANQNRCRR
jgi:hypothetical protein